MGVELVPEDLHLLEVYASKDLRTLDTKLTHRKEVLTHFCNRYKKLGLMPRRKPSLDKLIQANDNINCSFQLLKALQRQQATLQRVYCRRSKKPMTDGKRSYIVSWIIKSA